MSERTFAWWRLKLGFRGDEEFLTLAQLAPDRASYLAAVGLLICVFDSAHKSDQRSPKGAIQKRDQPYFDLLVEAGLLEADGSLPERTWAKYRVPNRARGSNGRYVAREPDHDGDHDGTSDGPRWAHDGTNTETERGVPKHRNESRDEGRAKSTSVPERLVDSAAWRRMEKLAAGGER